MQAVARDLVMLERYIAPTFIEIRLSRLSLPPAWRPAVLASLRVAMGTCVGAMFGAACGNSTFWSAVGVGLGAALGAIARHR